MVTPSNLILSNSRAQGMGKQNLILPGAADQEIIFK